MFAGFDNLCNELERQELESPTGVTTETVYSQLLAIYLYQNDLCNAKLLWKRIPQNIISDNPEIGAIWAIGKCLWKKNLPGTYVALSAYSWTEPVKGIIDALQERIREAAFKLIGRSYSSIHVDTVVKMTGLSKEMATQACHTRKWEISDGGTIITPSASTDAVPLSTSSEDQLFKLTEFVSFLEN